MVLIFLSVVCSSSSIWRGISILHAAFYAILFMHQKQGDVPIAKWCILAQKESVLCWDYFPKAYCKPVKRKTPESYLPSKTKTCKSSGCLESDSQNWLRKLREVLNPKPSIWNPKPSKFAVGCRLFELMNDLIGRDYFYGEFLIELMKQIFDSASHVRLHGSYK